EGTLGRLYLSFDETQVQAAQEEARRYIADPSIQDRLPTEPARGTFAGNAQGRIYGFKTFADYFTPRQLVALTTFSDLVGEAREQVLHDAVARGLPDDCIP